MVSDNRQNQTPKTNSNDENNQTEPKKLKTSETKSRVRRLIIYEWGFWVLVAVAGIVFFVNHTLAVISIPLLFVGLVSGAFAFRLSLINHGSKHGIANRWWAAIAVPALLLCGCLFGIVSSGNDSPNFVFSLRKLDKPEMMLALTNRFLSDVIWTYGITSKHVVRGLLIIPTESEQSDLTLRFGVDNKSSTAMAENPEFIITLPSKCDFMPEYGWTRVDSDRKEQQSWGCFLPDLLPTAGINVPDIHLKNVGVLFKSHTPILINITVESKNSKPQGISFGLFVSSKTIWKTNDFLKPIVIEIKPDTNGSGNLPLTSKELKELQQ